MIYVEKINSENGINGTEDKGGSIDGDFDNVVDDGDVEEIIFDIGLLFIGFIVVVVVVVVEGEAVEGDDVDKADGEEHEDG